MYCLSGGSILDVLLSFSISCIFPMPSYLCFCVVKSIIIITIITIIIIISWKVVIVLLVDFPA